MRPEEIEAGKTYRLRTGENVKVSSIFPFAKSVLVEFRQDDPAALRRQMFLKDFSEQALNEVTND